MQWWRWYSGDVFGSSSDSGGGSDSGGCDDVGGGVVVAIWWFCELENFSPRATARRSFIIIRTTVAGHYYFVHGE